MAISTHAQAPPRSRAQSGARHVKAAVPDAPTPYKGIFEAVNYGQDLNLTDVFFVSPEVGWVSGEHATILKTTNGGKAWRAQVAGDPSGNERSIGQLRFLDARHGWAVTGDSPQRLLRTMDGENWEQIGQQPAPGSGFVDYGFTSVRHGIALGGNMGGFYVTDDGGRHWVNVSPCKVQVRVQGLARIDDCRVKKLQMLSSRSGYAAADWSGGLAFLRTDDGGEHWSSIVTNISDCCGPDFFFTDLDHGIMVFNNGKTYLTADGAKTWRALISGSVGLTSGGQSPPLRFADPEVGWAVGPSPDNSDSFRVSYSTDSGQHWRMSHNIQFPIGPRYAELKFDFPRRDCAYVIGPHGMIYRYSIVPVNYTAANILNAPLMPPFGAMKLSAKADAIRRDIDVLRGKLAGLPGASQLAGASTTAEQSSKAASDSTAGMAAPDSGQPSAADVNHAPGSSNGPSSGGFSQPTDVSATAEAIASGNTGDSAGFMQDSAPPSEVFASCCATAVQQLQADTSGLVTQIPPVTSHMRPMNLIVAGLQLAATLMNQSQGLWNQFKTLKHAPNIQAAVTALQQLSTSLASVQQASSIGLQNPGAWFAANAPAAFTQDVGTGATGATGAGMGYAASAGIAPHNQQTQSSSAQPAAQPGADEAKQKINSKLKWPHM